jgi:uncharacterized protein (DUF305 family)
LSYCDQSMDRLAWYAMVSVRWRGPRMLGIGGVLLLVTVAVVALVATGGPDPGGSTGAPDPAASATGPSVIVPGRPGEPARTVAPDDVKAPDGTTYGPLDAAFIRMMIPHHVQAVEMAALAPTRSANPQILAIAGRIKAAQVPEIAQLRAWLRARGLKEDGGADAHRHLTMRGMQTPDAMRALAAATGDTFDRTFVAMMSDHHQGAIDMAQDILIVVRDGQVEEIATAIATEQAIEIARMRDALGG